MNATPQCDSVTFPHGFLDFLTLAPQRSHTVAGFELDPDGLARFNAALYQLSPDAPRLTLEQMASAAQRAFERYAPNAQPAFVVSRIAALERMEDLAADPAWQLDPELPRQLQVLREYRAAGNGLLPNHLPVIGLLDDAVLIDVALQLLRDELRDYEDFCRFRRVAADFAGVPIDATGLIREHWLEAMLQAKVSVTRLDGNAAHRYVPDPRSTLFHIA